MQDTPDSSSLFQQFVSKHAHTDNPEQNNKPGFKSYMAIVLIIIRQLIRRCNMSIKSLQGRRFNCRVKINACTSAVTCCQVQII